MTKLVKAEKLQVDVGGAEVQTQRVLVEQISRNQQHNSSKSKRARLARGEENTLDISEDEEDVELPAPAHTHRQVCIVISLTLRIASILFRKDG